MSLITSQSSIPNNYTLTIKRKIHINHEHHPLQIPQELSSRESFAISSVLTADPRKQFSSAKPRVQERRARSRTRRSTAWQRKQVNCPGRKTIFLRNRSLEDEPRPVTWLSVTTPPAWWAIQNSAKMIKGFLMKPCSAIAARNEIIVSFSWSRDPVWAVDTTRRNFCCIASLLGNLFDAVRVVIGVKEIMRYAGLSSWSNRWRETAARQRTRFCNTYHRFRFMSTGRRRYGYGIAVQEESKRRERRGYRYRVACSTVDRFRGTKIGDTFSSFDI